jgi:hypothetical protein
MLASPVRNLPRSTPPSVSPSPLPSQSDPPPSFQTQAPDARHRTQWGDYPNGQSDVRQQQYLTRKPLKKLPETNSTGPTSACPCATKFNGGPELLNANNVVKTSLGSRNNS